MMTDSDFEYIHSKGRKTATITIDGLPPTLNHAYGYNRKTGARYLKQEGKDYRNRVYWTVREQFKPGTEYPIFKKGERVRVEYRFYFSNRRRSDVFNREKILSDALEHAGILYDDYYIDDGRVLRRKGDKDMTQIKVEVI